MKIVFMGTPDFSVGCLEALVSSKHEVVGVVTQQDKPKNRGMSLSMPPVKECAITHGIPVFQPKSLKNQDSFERLAKFEADIFVVVAYGKLLPKNILNMPKYGSINVHASILPRHRGASPIQAAIVNGDTETGVTIMQMDEGLDTGDILHVKKTAISREDTGGSLHDRLSQIGAQALLEYLDILESGMEVRIHQDSSISTYAPLITKNDGRVSFEKEAERVANQIMGYAPWPGTFADLGNVTLKLFNGFSVENQSENQDFGKIDSVSPEGLTVKCKKGKIIIKEIQKAGGKRMSPQDFFRGRPELLKERFN